MRKGLVLTGVVAASAALGASSAGGADPKAPVTSPPTTTSRAIGPTGPAKGPDPKVTTLPETPLTGSSMRTNGVLGQTGAAGAGGVRGIAENLQAVGVTAENTRSGTVGQLATGTSGVAGWTAGGAVAAPAVNAGVWGAARSANHVGVLASGVGPTSTALHIHEGLIKVSGASAPMFLHKATSTPGWGGVKIYDRCRATTWLDHPAVNGDPNALIVATARDNDPWAIAVLWVPEKQRWNLTAWRQWVPGVASTPDQAKRKQKELQAGCEEIVRALSFAVFVAKQ